MASSPDNPSPKEAQAMIEELLVALDVLEDGDAKAEAVVWALELIDPDMYYVGSFRDFKRLRMSFGFSRPERLKRIASYSSSATAARSINRVWPPYRQRLIYFQRQKLSTSGAGTYHRRGSIYRLSAIQLSDEDYELIIAAMSSR